MRNHCREIGCDGRLALVRQARGDADNPIRLDDAVEVDHHYLRMSYLVGPHEGWVAAPRNYIALANFPELPQDVAEAAVTEFKDLVVSGYYDTAVKILVGPGWPIHDMLLRRLEDAPEEARRQFDSSANALGYEIAVPGVERPEPRPWR